MRTKRLRVYSNIDKNQTSSTIDCLTKIQLIFNKIV